MKLKKYNKLIFYFTFIIVFIFLISLLMFPEISQNISKLLRLGIIPMEGPTITAIPVELGSGVNITAGTVIRLTGLNCNLTLADDHLVNKLEVYPNYLLMNVSVTPTWIEGLPYVYSDGIINITCFPDSIDSLYVNITSLGNIKIYDTSEGSKITSASWSDTNKNFSFTVDSATTSIVKVRWPDTFGPDIKECSVGSCSSSFDPGTQIVTLTATHASPVTWTLHQQTESGAPQWTNLKHIPDTVVTILDPVTINVTWYDDVNFDTVIIWENSTGDWQNHVLPA